MLAAGIAVYMMVIAPYRSYPAGEAKIHQAQEQLASDQSEIPASGGSNSQVIAADQQALTQARADLAQAQQVDRWSVGMLAILDIPLSAAGFLGAELLLLDLAVFRAGLARRQSQRADDALRRTDSSYIDALHQTQTRHGHTDADELIPQIIARVSRLGSSIGSSSTGGSRLLPGSRGDRPAGLALTASLARPPGAPGPWGNQRPGVQAVSGPLPLPQGCRSLPTGDPSPVARAATEPVPSPESRSSTRPAAAPHLAQDQ